MAVVGVCWEGTHQKGTCREGACRKKAYYKESNISSKVTIVRTYQERAYKEGAYCKRAYCKENSISSRVGISSKIGIGVSFRENTFRSFKLTLLLHRNLSIVYSRGVDK